MSKLWEKESKVDKKIEEFTVGNDYILDEELIRYDCLGSIAHCRMLGKIGILEDKEVEKTIGILEEIEEDFGRAKMIKINLWHIRLYMRCYYQ